MTLLFTVKTEEIKMNEFENARKEIEIIDRQLVELFERRMEMAAVIGEYKSENGLSVRDHDRDSGSGGDQRYPGERDRFFQYRNKRSGTVYTGS